MWSVCAAVLTAAALPVRATPPMPENLFVTIEIDSVGALSVPQGEPFDFRVKITNRLPLMMSGTVRTSIVAPDGSEGSLPSWRGLLPPSGTVSLPRSVTTSQFFASIGTFTVKAHGDFLVQQASALGAIATSEGSLDYQVTPPRVSPPVFRDVTASSGIDTFVQTGFECQDYAAGAAWSDVSGDGLPDLYVPNKGEPAALWINQGDGHFVDEAAAYGVLDQNSDGSYPAGIGAVFADYNNDGRPDLLVLNDGVNRLYRNDGGHFTDVTQLSGLTDDANHTSAAWGDYDGDGFLDVFVTSHGRLTSCDEPFTQLPDRLYHNNGDGTFTDVSDLLPHSSDGWGLSFQGAWLDYDKNGRQDLYLANDHIGPFDQPNYLWRNDGPDSSGRWIFTDVSATSGAGITHNAMGLGIGDYDRDGDLDVAVSNIGATALLRNAGDGTFADVGSSAGVTRAVQPGGENPPTTWSLGFYDFSNKGWEDLYVSAGTLLTNGGATDPNPNMMYVADGTGHFIDLSAPSHTDDPGASRGVAFADFDGDGRMDMLVVNRGGRCVSITMRRRVPATGSKLRRGRVRGTATRAARSSQPSLRALRP